MQDEYDDEVRGRLRQNRHWKRVVENRKTGRSRKNECQRTKWIDPFLNKVRLNFNLI